jgi:hypothetical protein
MAVGSIQSSWKDSSCAATTFDQQRVAPICQKDRLCPEGGWELFEGHCYLFVGHLEAWAWAHWADAEMDCNEKGGHLASIHSFAENNFIRGIAHGHYFWIGGSDTTVEVRFSIYVLYIHMDFLCTGGVSIALFILLLISKLFCTKGCMCVCGGGGRG